MYGICFPCSLFPCTAPYDSSVGKPWTPGSIRDPYFCGQKTISKYSRVWGEQLPERLKSIRSERWSLAWNLHCSPFPHQGLGKIHRKASPLHHPNDLIITPFFFLLGSDKAGLAADLRLPLGSVRLQPPITHLLSCFLLLYTYPPGALESWALVLFKATDLGEQRNNLKCARWKQTAPQSRTEYLPHDRFYCECMWAEIYRTESYRDRGTAPKSEFVFEDSLRCVWEFKWNQIKFWVVPSSTKIRAWEDPPPPDP